MSIYLEITQLENGDIVLREAEEAGRAEEVGRADEVGRTEVVADQADPWPDAAVDGASAEATGEREPLVRISFSEEVKDMLGNELVGVAEAMIDAATDFLEGESITLETRTPAAPVIH